MSLEQEVELIRQFPIFSKIQPAMQKLLCFSSERLTYDAGQVMFNAGDAGDAAFIIIEGEVEIFGDVPRTATAKATSKLETLKISKDLFVKVIRENPDAAVELIKILA